MTIRRLILPALIGLTLIAPTGVGRAQQAGTVELGGFGQVDHMDEAMRTKRIGYGFGGRAGIFLGRHWEVEAEASMTQADPEPSRTSKAQINYYVGRLNYNIPFGSSPGNAIILSGGAGGTRLDAHSDFLLSPEIGIRKMLGNVFAVRFDVSGMIAPNPNSATFKFPPVAPARNDQAAYLTNYQARLGLSLLLGNTRPYEPPPVFRAEPMPAPMPEPAPPPRAAPAPAPAPAPRFNQDSADAANRARALLNAPIYFDFDKSEIRSDARQALDSKIPLLRANSGMRIRIEGNTDSRGSNEYNMALGLRRANAARRYLVSQGIDNGRFDVVSYGEERPVDQGSTEDAYAKNRRDDFVITVGSDNISVPR